MTWCVCGGGGAVKCPRAAGAGVVGGASLYVAQEAYDLKLADLYMHLSMFMPCMLVCVFGDGYMGGEDRPRCCISSCPLEPWMKSYWHLSCYLESFMRIVRS